MNLLRNLLPVLLRNEMRAKTEKSPISFMPSEDDLKYLSEQMRETKLDRSTVIRKLLEYARTRNIVFSVELKEAARAN